MNKLLTVMIMALLVGMFSHTSQAQITVSNSGDFLAPGTRINNWDIDTMNAEIYDQFTGATGGNQVWDLTGRSFTKESVGVVVDKSTAPSADSFPDANVAVLVVDTLTPPDSIWSFTEVLPLSITLWGSVGHYAAMDESIIKYQSSTPDYVFPIEYNSQWVSTHMYTVPLFEGSYTEYYDTTFNTVDAWGTITYGDRTIPCLRVSFVSSLTTKTYVSGVPLPPNVSTDEGAEFVGAGFECLFSLGRSTDVGTDAYYGEGGDDLVGNPTGVRENNPGMLPTGFDLSQNYPNPFNPTTEIRFSLPRNTVVHLSIYNMLGQEVKTLIDQPMDAGIYNVDWNGTSDAGSPVASGIYFYKLTAGEISLAKKMVLLK